MTDKNIAPPLPALGANCTGSPRETRQWAQTFCTNVGSILSSQPELCDVTFLVGPDCEPVRGVRAILACRSEVFRSMLFGDSWAEQKEGEAIKMAENGPAAFRAMMQYLHSGSVTFDPATAMELLQLSDYFSLDELKSGCGEYIAKSINADTAAMVLQTASDLGQASLVEKCIQFIEFHTDEVLSSESFTDAYLSSEVLCQILQSDRLSHRSELSLYSATVAWGRSYCEQHPGLDLVEILRQPLTHVRLPLIPASDLMSVVRPSNLVPMDYLLESLAFQADPGTVDTSRVCFRKRSGREKPHWDPEYMSGLSIYGGHLYEFSADCRTATKAQMGDTKQVIRASEPLEPGKVHVFAFKIDKWEGGDIDIGFGANWDRNCTELRKRLYAAPQHRISEGDTIVVRVDLVSGKATFAKQGGARIWQIIGIDVSSIDFYPAAAFCTIGSRVSFLTVNEIPNLPPR